MGSITMAFAKNINVSAQPGDTAYYTNDINGADMVLIGLITATTNNSITVNISTSVDRPSGASFILFSKPAEVNTSGLKGNYAEVQFSNNSETTVELFSIGSEAVESSN